ncbi:cytochrome P450 [Colletotrichum tofieldiae]|nr:cytochrome P450 [Colletotrichum tofieldiae]
MLQLLGFELLTTKAFIVLFGGGIGVTLVYFLHLYNVWPFGNDVEPATPDQLRHIPLLRFEGSNSVERYMNETRSLLKQGYEKYLRQGIPFQIRHPVGELGSQVLLPTKYLEEVKKAPTDLFSFEAYSEKSFLLNYSRAPRQTEAAAQIIRVDLNRNLGALVTDLWNEAAHHLNENIAFKWKKVPAYELVCSFVARVASVALVGAPLCRNPAWQRIVVETTFVAFGRHKPSKTSTHHAGDGWLPGQSRFKKT